VTSKSVCSPARVARALAHKGWASPPAKSGLSTNRPFISSSSARVGVIRAAPVPAANRGKGWCSFLLSSSAAAVSITDNAAPPMPAILTKSRRSTAFLLNRKCRSMPSPKDRYFLRTVMWTPWMAVVRLPAYSG
jgi:hypothetical protein